MIKGLNIENFKCFSTKTKIDLSNITICAGMNSVGKSSMVQSLLILRETYDAIVKYRGTNKNRFKIRLNNNYSLQLGDTSQIISSSSSFNSNVVTIGVDDIKFKYQEGEDKLSFTCDTAETSEKLSQIKSVFADNFYYLNAERLGPRNYQVMESYEKMHCGFHGEYTFDIISKNQLLKVSEGRQFRNMGGKTVKTLVKQIEYWIDYIVGGIEISFSSDLALRLSQMKIKQSVFDTEFNSPYNFGFGISYILPIITTGLIAEKDAMIIVENPEAHLHPCGQSRIGQFLSQIASDNVQVVIETHSEHVINGIRIHALKNDINKDNICINYFSIDSNKDKHNVERVELNERMDIMEWPEGFLDQEENDLKILRDLRREKGGVKRTMGGKCSK